MKKVIAAGTSSAMLYIYHYAVLLLLSFALLHWLKLLAGIPIMMMIALVWNAKTMKYQLTEDSLYISGSFLDKESSLIPLQDIKGFYIVNRQPWRFFGLGTVLVIVDVDSDSQPCIRCVKDPIQLAKNMRRYALKNNAQFDPELEWQVVE